MTEITLRFQTEKAQIDPAFFDNLNTLARQYGVQVAKNNAPATKEENYQTRKRQLEDFIRKADALAEGMGPQTIDSTDLIREERERL